MNREIRYRMASAGFWVGAIAIGGGGWAVAVDHFRDMRSDAAIVLSMKQREIERLQAQKVQLETSNVTAVDPVALNPSSAPEPSASTTTADRSNAMSLISSLLKDGSLKIVGPPPSRDPRPDILSPDHSGRFPPGFAELFNLSEKEFAALQSGMVDMQQRMDAKLVAGAKVQHDEGGPVVITLSALPDVAEIQEEFRQFLERAIGSQNLSTFLALRSAGIDDFFRGFGAAARTINLSTTAGTYQGQAGIGPGLFAVPGGYASAFGNWTREKVIESLGPLAPLLPADF